MTKMSFKIYHLILFIFVILIIIYLLFYTLLFYPGLYMSLKTTITCNEEIEKNMICQTQVVQLLSKLDNFKKERIYCNPVLERIGTASYMSIDYNSYIEETIETNNFMINNFESLYKQLKEHIETRLNIKCIYPGLKCYKNKKGYPNLAMPGFHIFKGGSILGRGWNVASIHVDLQYKKIDWPKDKKFNFEKTISFTLAINVPDNSGLYLFDKQFQENNGLIIPGLYFRNMKKQKIIYKPGCLYLHSGHTYHMISSFKDKKDRITLQGHGIYNETDNEYWLYW